MKLLGLRSLIYPTDDIVADTAWWTEVIGVQPYFEAKEYVGFDVGGYEIGLFAPGKLADGPVTYIGVEDVQEAYDALLAQNCTEHEQPVEVGGGIVMASVKRANGLLVGVIYNPNFKS